jgi:hypothetical protein
MIFRKRGETVAPMGRPKSENPKSVQLAVRLDEETLKKLDENARYFNETRVDSLRRGIEEVNKAINKD